MVNKGNLTTHTKLNEQLLKAINLNSEGQDQQTSSLNVDISPQKFLDSQSSECEVIENDTNSQHHTMRVWRQKFARSIPKLGKDRTRTTTQFLTGHCELNSRINKFKPTTRTVPKTCPHCLMEKETMNHFIGQCPKWSYQRGGYFESFYLSVTDIVDKFSLPSQG